MNQPYVPSGTNVHLQENLKCIFQKLLGWQRSMDLGTSHTYGQTLLHLLPASLPGRVIELLALSCFK